MIRHIVFLKWLPGTDDERVDEVEAALRTMPEVMPFIRRYEMGRDLALNGSHDFAVVADFDTVDDYLTYADQPDHKKVIVELVGPILESSARVQFTL